MGSFIAARGFWKPSIEDRGMNYFCLCWSLRAFVSVCQNKHYKLLSSTDSFGS